MVLRKMKVNVVFVIAAFLLISVFSGCTSMMGLFKQKISVNKAVSFKEVIDEEPNPARQYVIKNDLENKRVVINSVLVKDIVESSNIDYDFSVIVEVDTDKGPIDCYIYSHDIKSMAQLQKDESTIKIEGDFSRFFSMLDDSYTKIEIINASITKLN